MLFIDFYKACDTVENSLFVKPFLSLVLVDPLLT